MSRDLFTLCYYIIELATLKQDGDRLWCKKGGSISLPLVSFNAKFNCYIKLTFMYFNLQWIRLELFFQEKKKELSLYIIFLLNFYFISTHERIHRFKICRGSYIYNKIYG